MRVSRNRMLFLFFLLIIAPSFARAGEKWFEAKLIGAEELYKALKVDEVQATSGDVRFRYKTTVSPKHLSEGGLYCEKKASADCVLASKMGLQGRVVIVEGVAAEKIFNAINPNVAIAQFIQPDTTYYQLNGLVCIKTVKTEATKYLCTASDS